MQNLKVYQCKDGRYRAYYHDDSGNRKFVSYPRLLVEEYLGRKLLPEEDVHHKDGDKTNNNIDNLEVVLHGTHQKQHSLKYKDKLAICEVCGNSFIWTGKRQCKYYIDLRRNKNRIISCSKNCSSLYGRLRQLGKI